MFRWIWALLVTPVRLTPYAWRYRSGHGKHTIDGPNAYAEVGASWRPELTTTGRHRAA